MFQKEKTEKKLLYNEINRLEKLVCRLEEENKCLRGGLEDIEKHREKYKELIAFVEGIREKYKEGLSAFEGLGAVYEEELKRLRSSPIVEGISAD